MGIERGAVPRVHARIEHDVGTPGGDEAVPIAIAPRNVAARLRFCEIVPALAEPLAQGATVSVGNARVAQRW